MRKYSRNFKLAVFLYIVLLFGLVNIIINETYQMLLVFLLFGVSSVLLIYFNYSLCKRSVRWNAHWDTREGEDNVEPSEFRLIMGKIGGWAFFFFAMILSLIQF